MFMLDHISITVRDIYRARLFYDAIFAALGVVKVYDRPDAIGYGQRNRADDDAHSYLSIFESPKASPDARRHYCFRAPSPQHVLAFFEAGLQAGGVDNGPPGLRPHYHAGYFAAFLKDPEGNCVEAVCHHGDTVS
jgi:catechol 2,3-dioxygenase-like lactoylglutathione lyase family enzyme